MIAHADNAPGSNAERVAFGTEISSTIELMSWAVAGCAAEERVRSDWERKSDATTYGIGIRSTLMISEGVIHFLHKSQYNSCDYLCAKTSLEADLSASSSMGINFWLLAGW